MLAILFSPAVYAQQEPVYTQFGMNQSVFNPAYTVVNDVINIALMSRVQWVGLNGAPITNTLIGSTTFYKSKGGAGLILHNNSYGVSTNLEIMGQAAYKVPVGLRGQLSVGIQGGYMNYRNDFTKIPEADLDPLFGPVNESFSKPNVGMGVFYNAEFFYVGLSIPKFINYKSSTTDLLNYKRRFYGSAGVIAPLGPVHIKAYILSVMWKDNFSFNLGGSVLMGETIWAGIFTRDLKAFGAMGQIELTDHLKAGLTVEMPSTQLVTGQYGSYEVFISWEMALLNRQIVKRRYF